MFENREAHFQFFALLQRIAFARNSQFQIYYPNILEMSPKKNLSHIKEQPGFLMGFSFVEIGSIS
jgi:hypothetical protein